MGISGRTRFALAPAVRVEKGIHCLCSELECDV